MSSQAITVEDLAVFLEGVKRELTLFSDVRIYGTPTGKPYWQDTWGVGKHFWSATVFLDGLKFRDGVPACFGIRLDSLMSFAAMKDKVARCIDDYEECAKWDSTDARVTKPVKSEVAV